MNRILGKERRKFDYDTEIISVLKNWDYSLYESVTTENLAEILGVTRRTMGNYYNKKTKKHFLQFLKPKPDTATCPV